MEKRISMKTFYLIGIISIGLIGLAVGSTYAMFTASAEINNPISLSSNLTSDNDVIETFDVVIKPYSTASKTVKVTNSTSSSANYTIWYLDYGDNVSFGTSGSSTSGSIASSGSVSTLVTIRNNTSSPVTITIGVSTSLGSIVLGDDMQIIPNQSLPGNVVNQNAAAYITNLYKVSDKETVTNNSITYNTVPSRSLMNDRKGGTTSLDNGNVRYYGANPNNYVYFNCSNYSNQSSSTCEVWRIIGVFDGKLKLIRNSSIGSFSWDNKNTSTGAESAAGKNNWSDARLMKLLNPDYEAESIGGSLYYNARSGKCYAGRNNATVSCNFTSTGIKNDETRNLIAETSWGLGGWNDSVVYSDFMYGKERGTSVYNGHSTSWNGKIALPYPSDFGYSADFSTCTTHIGDYDNCPSSSWMLTLMGTTANSLLLTPFSDDGSSIWGIMTPGYATSDDFAAYGNENIFPTLYLKSDIGIGSGDGSSSSPYTLSVDGIEVILYDVLFNNNGGSGGPNSVQKFAGETITISSSVPTKEGYTFKGWTVVGDTTQTLYQPGDTYVINNNTTFVAVWEEVPSATQYTVTLKKSVSSVSTITTSKVNDGDKFSYSFDEVVPVGYSYNRVSCTNGQVATYSLGTGGGTSISNKRTVTIAKVTSDTVCTVYYTKRGGTITS